MATRSHIGVKNQDGTIDYIYCHYDGYPEHNGVILAEYYQTLDKVNQLLELGDLSVLGESVGEKHDFYKPNSEWCLAYGRDRGEPDTNKRTSTFDELLNNKELWVDYLYVFDNNKWYCYNTYDKEPINLYLEAES